MASLAETNPMLPRFFRVRRSRRELADTWTLELEPAGAVSVPRPASSTCCTRSGSAKSRSRSAATRRSRTTLVHTIRAVGTVTRGAVRRQVGAAVGVRGPYRYRLARRAGGGRRRGARRGRHRARAAPARRSTTSSREPGQVRRVSILYRRAARPRALLYRPSCERWRARIRPADRGHGRRGDAVLARQRGRGDRR